MAGNGTGEVKRPMRRAAQKLNMSMSSISPASQENNTSKHVGKGNFLVFEIEPDFDEELPNIKSVPSSQDDEISKDNTKP